MKVLIYGFGWAGRSCIKLLEVLGVQCSILDDNQVFDNKLDSRFVELTDIDVFDFDLILICVINQEVSLRLKNRLIDYGFSNCKIKNFRDMRITSNIANEFVKAHSDINNLMQYFTESDFHMSNFHENLDNFIVSYYKNKREDKHKLNCRYNIDSTFLNFNVFSKMHMMSDNWYEIDSINYPGFTVWSSILRRNDKNFYFIDEIDFNSLKNRDRNVKLVVLFGNSAMRTEYLVGGSISDYLAKNSNMIVVNAGVSGSTIYEQLLVFNSLFYIVKPDIVISCFGGIDIFLGFLTCDSLLIEHKMIYYPGMWEKSYKKKIKSKLPLFDEMKAISGAVNHSISIIDICNAVRFRLQQFNSYVLSCGSQFYGFIQPVLPCKKVWSDEEVQMRRKEEVLFTENEVYQIDIFKHFPYYIQQLRDTLCDLEYVSDLNEVIMDVKYGIFTNNWIHCNELGNEIIASSIFDRINRKS